MNIWLECAQQWSLLIKISKVSKSGYKPSDRFHWPWQDLNLEHTHKKKKQNRYSIAFSLTFIQLLPYTVLATFLLRARSWKLSRSRWYLNLVHRKLEQILWGILTNANNSTNSPLCVIIKFIYLNFSFQAC